jgi:hypothetical protein
MSSSERAATLHAVIQALAVPHGYERSIKLRDQGLFGNRFLLTVGRDDLGANAADRVLDVCRGLEMSREFLEAAARLLPAANMIHFGFEEEQPGRDYYKLYLENEAAFTRALSLPPPGPEPFVLHHAFKWNAADRAEQVVARYVCHPRMARQAMLQRIADVYAGVRERTPWHLLCELLTAAARRVPEEQIMYLDVSEEGTIRKSFDVNFYRAGFAVNSVAPSLDRLAAHFRLSAAAVEEAFAGVLGSQLGHIAGGVDRHGRDFLTIYFGVEGRA